MHCTSVKEGSMILQQSTPAQKTRKKLPGLLIAGFITLATVAVLGGGGIVAAQSAKPSKQACMHAGYHNYGQCVSDWQHQQHHTGGNGNGNGGGGSGYGGGNTSVIGDISLILNNSNNNVINVIINIFR